MRSFVERDIAHTLVVRTIPVRGGSMRSVRGQALLVLLVMISIAAMLLVYGSVSEVARAVKSERQTRATLEYAKQALIGRAIGDASRPGSLPCPDTDDDGSADLFVGSSCPSYIGRLPWRTLGIGDLRDDAGERLWYALSPGFRDHPAAPALNSDTHGTLTVHSVNNTTVISREAIAIVFAAGLALPGQQRDSKPAQCATTGKHVPRDRCATNYLDTAEGFSNAGEAGPYIAAAAGAVYNDRLAVIVTADLMPLVEQRVALEIRNALLAYKAGSTCRCYPWADNSADGTSDVGSNRGRLPVVKAMPEPWGAGVLPAYVAANDWTRVIYYAASRNALENGGAACASCVEPHLTIDGGGGYELVLLTPGHARPNTPRVSLADYIDDFENRNDDDRYVTPLAPGADRDRIYGIATANAGCSVNARVLLHNVPCGTGPGAVRAVCDAANASLGKCKCAAAAAALAKGACANTLGGAFCDAAINQLQACDS